MKNKRIYFFGSIILGLLIILFIIYNILAGRVTMNPPGTVGNTAGNLNNGGLFCEYDGMVYFSNSYDGGRLYSMNVDEGNIKKLNDVNVRNILAGGKYLYFFRMANPDSKNMEKLGSIKSFNQCRLDGSKSVAISRDVVINAQLVDNYIYMMTVNGSTAQFSKVKIDKSESIALSNNEINPSCVVNGTIYYNGVPNDHYLYALDTTSDASRVIWTGNVWNPIVQGDYVYYMDVENNYRLCRYSLTQEVVEVLTNDRVDCYNLNGNYIYYQSNGEHPALKCMYVDGTGLQEVASGIFTNINMTSQFVYFQEYGKESVLYHSYLGSAFFEEFTDARNATFEK